MFINRIKTLKIVFVKIQLKIVVNATFSTAIRSKLNVFEKEWFKFSKISKVEITKHGSSLANNFEPDVGQDRVQEINN